MAERRATCLLSSKEWRWHSRVAPSAWRRGASLSRDWLISERRAVWTQAARALSGRDPSVCTLGCREGLAEEAVFGTVLNFNTLYPPINPYDESNLKKITQYPKNESRKTALRKRKCLHSSKAGYWISINQSNSSMLEKKLICTKLNNNEIQRAHVPKSTRTARPVVCAKFTYVLCAWTRTRGQVIPVNVFLSSPDRLGAHFLIRSLNLWNI